MLRRRRLIVQTSRGPLELLFEQVPGGGRFTRRFGLSGGYGVVVTLFDDAGWETSKLGWLSAAPKDGKALDEFLSDFAGLGADEARRIAQDAVASWLSQLTSG